jgi:hypothetical protein
MEATASATRRKMGRKRGHGIRDVERRVRGCIWKVSALAFGNDNVLLGMLFGFVFTSTRLEYACQSFRGHGGAP